LQKKLFKREKVLYSIFLESAARLKKRRKTQSTSRKALKAKIGFSETYTLDFTAIDIIHRVDVWK